MTWKKKGVEIERGRKKRWEGRTINWQEGPVEKDSSVDWQAVERVMRRKYKGKGRKKVVQRCHSFLYSIILFTQKRDLEFKLKYGIWRLCQLCSLIRKDAFRNTEIEISYLKPFLKITKKDNNAIFSMAGHQEAQVWKIDQSALVTLMEVITNSHSWTNWCASFIAESPSINLYPSYIQPQWIKIMQ